MNHTDLLNIIAKKINANYYLEIGVRFGANFNKIEVPNKIGVDPDPESVATVHLTSDQFFEQNKETFDLVFIDGYHEAEQVKRDIINSYAVLTGKGIIVVHDCNPEKEEHTHIPRDCKVWNGNVYKTISELNKAKMTVDIDHGCCIISRSTENLRWGNVAVDWEIFSKHRKDLLNLVSPEDALGIIDLW